ncbi:MAG: thioredoxin family protein [Pyramidobacter sp.]
MSAVTVITKENYTDEVMNSVKPVLLDFWSERCSYCRALAPLVDEVAEKTPSVKVGKISFDDQRGLVEQFGVRSLPTLIFMKNGKELCRSVGLVSKEKIQELIRL